MSVVCNAGLQAMTPRLSSDLAPPKAFGVGLPDWDFGA